MLKFLDHYRGTAIAAIAVALLGVLMVGCQPTVQSPISGQRVTEAQLIAEAEDAVRQIQLEQQALAFKAETLADRVQLSLDELEAKRNAINAAVQTVQQLVAANDPSSGALAGLLGLLGGGLMLVGQRYDNSRKDRVIERLKSQGQS